MGLLSLLNLEFAPKRLVLKFENNFRGGTVSKSQFKTNQSIQIDVCNTGCGICIWTIFESGCGI